MESDLTVEELVGAAAAGQASAWDQLVDRFAGLVWSVCRQYRLTNEDASDVSQTVWLRLVEQLNTIREPAAVGGWLVTTARREALRVLREKKRSTPIEGTGEFDLPVDTDAVATDARLLLAERNLVLRRALAELPEPCRSLLTTLVRDERRQYAEISAELGMPIGSIGPTRSRCLDRIRKNSGLRALFDIDSPAPARRK